MKIRTNAVGSASYTIETRGAQFALVASGTRNTVATRAFRFALIAYAVAMGLTVEGVDGAERLAACAAAGMRKEAI